MAARPLAIAAFLAIALVSGGLSYLGERIAPVPAPAPAAPSILDGLSRADAAALTQFYAAMADIVVRDGLSKEPVVRTTLELRNRHEGALKLAFASTGLAGKYPGLGERLDNHLMAAIGDTDVPLDGALREKAAQAFRDVK